MQNRMAGFFHFRRFFVLVIILCTDLLLTIVLLGFQKNELSSWLSRPAPGADIGALGRGQRSFWKDSLFSLESRIIGSNTLVF